MSKEKTLNESENNQTANDQGVVSSKLLDAAIQNIANAVCPHVPIGHVITLNFENGAVYVELIKHRKFVNLPDTADKPLSEQLNDAICVANGFSI